MIFANDRWEQCKTNVMFKSPHLLRHIRGCSTEERPEKKFVDVCLDIISSGKHQLRKNIILPVPKKERKENKATAQSDLNTVKSI